MSDLPRPMPPVPIRGCRWADGKGRSCCRAEEHPSDASNPNHRQRLTLVREFDLDGRLISEVVE